MTLPEEWAPPDNAYETVVEPATERMAAAQYGVQGILADHGARAINEVRASMLMLAKAAVPSKTDGGLSSQGKST